MSKDCFVFIEDTKSIKDISLQLLSEAQRIKQDHPKHIDNIVALYLTSNDIDVTCLYKYGADQVIIVKHDLLSSYDTVIYADVIKQVTDQYKPSIFLIGGSIIGRDLAPRVSAKLQTGLTADTTHLAIEDETGLFMMTRPAFGGNINATIVCDEKTPQMATVRANVFEKEIFNNTKKLPIYFDALVTRKPVIKLLKEVPKQKQDSDITNAKIIVSGGRGVSKCFESLSGIAKALDGEVGASRAIVDQHIATKEIQVGQTGTTVRPVIYFACGISGAIQHTAGMDKSELIIALNTDENAPIFDIADIGLVVNAKEVLPLLQERLQTLDIRRA